MLASASSYLNTQQLAAYESFLNQRLVMARSLQHAQARVEN